MGGEVVFNTSMTGYQEVLTDPSYSGQMVTMTYPLIGNYGVNLEDVESDRVQVAAFIVKEYQPYPSNYRSTSTLADYLDQNGILGVEGLDTRALTRHIRTAGAMRGYIGPIEAGAEALVARAKAIPSIQGLDLAQNVTTERPFLWEDNQPRFLGPKTVLDKTIWQNTAKRRVVAIDCGIKYNILRCLVKSDCEVVVVPGTTGADTIKALEPDGIFVSNGPGDPEPVNYAVETIRSLLDYKPIFGICLGIQLLGLALGGKTYKLKFGHRGANQPVMHLATGKVEITSQNHGFAVDMQSLDEKEIELTHINLNDKTVEGFRHRSLPVFAVQYHPEASPGPHDAHYLFEEFTCLMDNQ